MRPTAHARPDQLFPVLTAILVAFAAGPSPADPQATASEPQAEAAPAIGPMIGHTTHEGVIIWIRTGQPGEHRLSVHPRNADAVDAGTRTAAAHEDFTLRWRVSDLAPDTEHTYSFTLPDGSTFESDDFVFRTPPGPAEPQRVTIAFGARADTTHTPVWTRIQAERADALVLLGDSPSLEATDLDSARAAHRELLAVPELSRLVRRTPTWATWGDRDFGPTGADGNFEGKFDTRQAFMEYRAHDEFGLQGEGVYTRFRLGPVEVYLIDTRSFVNIEPSPVSGSEYTLLGLEQWRWLTQSLAASNAPFKILASGIIWDHRMDGKGHDWGRFAHERDALIYMLGQAQIPGLVLLAGDLGVSRAMRFPTHETLGYDVWQLLPGPLGGRAEPDTWADHSAIIHNAARPGVFLKLTADSTVEPAVLDATWIAANGDRLFSIRLTTQDLFAETPPFGVHHHDH